MAMWQVYRGELVGKIYYGATSLDLEDRCGNMKTKPVFWLRGHKDLPRLKLEGVLGRRVSEDKALALEAALTAINWADSPEQVRGGPYCLGRLDGKLMLELRQLGKELISKKRLCHHEQVEIVVKVAQMLPRTGALNRHLRGECFKCGRKFQRCHCKNLRRSDDRPPSGNLKKRRPSGKSKSGSWKRRRWGLQATDDRYKQHKWGGDVVKNRQSDNSKQNAKR